MMAKTSDSGKGKLLQLDPKKADHNEGSPFTPPINYPKTDLKIPVGLKTSLIPAGNYQAKVADIKFEKSPYQNKQILVFLFEIIGGGYGGTQIKAFANAGYDSFSANTKIYQWFSLVTGESPEPGENMHLDEFFGKVLRVRVEQKISRKTKILFSNVVEILEVLDEF